AEKLQLTDKQKEDIAKAVNNFKQVLATGSDIQKKSARPIFEKMIAAQLTDEQKAAYEKLSGVPAGGVPAPPGGARPVAGAPAGAAAQRDPTAEVTVSADGKITM